MRHLIIGTALAALALACACDKNDSADQQADGPPVENGPATYEPNYVPIGWEDPPPTMPKQMLGMSANGKTINMPIGGEITVKLRGNPGTGDGWAVQSITDPMIQDLGHIFTPDRSDVIGGPGWYIFQFEVMTDGNGSISIQHVIRGEPQPSFSINVRSDG